MTSLIKSTALAVVRSKMGHFPWPCTACAIQQTLGSSPGSTPTAELPGFFSTKTSFSWVNNRQFLCYQTNRSPSLSLASRPAPASSSQLSTEEGTNFDDDCFGATLQCSDQTPLPEIRHRYNQSPTQPLFSEAARRRHGSRSLGNWPIHARCVKTI